MSPGRLKLPSKTAALAGVPAGVQATGPWIGRRQLYVRFAGEAETATIYTADALKGELKRLAARSRYHSIAIAGREPLAEEEFLQTALSGESPLPVMLEHDGQRPEELGRLAERFALIQISVDGGESEAELERVAASLQLAARKQVKHALAIVPADAASDARLHQIVEQVHAASAEAAIVVHPSVESASGGDRRWVLWLERVMAVHDDVRIVPRLPAPTGMR